MDRAETVSRLVEPSLTDMGYDLVRVRLSGSGRVVLQVMAERSDGAAMTVDDCAEISRIVSALLDVEDPVPGAYTLEVSSPGIDRPLVRPRDYERFAGFEARLETAEPVDGRRRFRGRIIGIADGTVRIDCDGAPVALPFATIQSAKLVLTDDLIAAHGGISEG